jgi:ribokinase
MVLAPTVAVVGSINMDLSFVAERVPLRGENLRARSLDVGLGGKGSDAAIAVARLQGGASLVACVGDDDFGRQALAALQAEGVQAGGVHVLPDAATGVALIMVDDAGENTILVVIGANERLEASQVRASLEALSPPPDALLVNFEIPGAAAQAAIAWGRERDLPVIVDAGPVRDYGPDVWGAADILSPNVAETAHLSGLPVTDLPTARAAAARLRAQGPRAVALKLGARGCLLLDEAGARLAPAYRVTPVDTTGAGDAWSAGLALALARGWSLDEAAAFANACGAVAVTKPGAVASMPTLAEVQALQAAQTLPPFEWLG